MHTIEEQQEALEKLHAEYVAELHTLQAGDREIVRLFLEQVKERKIAALRSTIAQD